MTNKEIEQELSDLKQLAAIQQKSLETLHAHLETLRRAVEAASRILVAITVPETQPGDRAGRN